MKNKIKQRDINLLGIAILCLLLINFAGSYFFQRFDLTSEKRYTLAGSTRQMLGKLDDVVYVKIYLTGDLNPGFTRLRNETREMLDEFRAYSDKQVEYEFIDPNENTDKKEVENFQRELYNKGIVPEQVVEKNTQKTSETLLWPGAVISYKGKETVWQIYKAQVGMAQDVSINNSVNDLEYGLTNAIRKLKALRRPTVAILEGHGELDTIRMADYTRALQEYYNVVRLSLNHQIEVLKRVDAIVVANPDSAFDEKDKFIIDQFIMRGGKSLWMIDPVDPNLDTLRVRGMTVGLTRDLNLTDLFFKYGVRLNPVLVQDKQCGVIPINVGFSKGQPKFDMFPWIYEPLVLPTTDHPIVKNLDLIKFDYAGTIDTVATKQAIKKTILLTSSRYTKTQPTPARIALAYATFQQKESQFTNPYQPLACLLEGEFESVFKNRIAERITQDTLINFKTTSKPTKMIVISDGDVAKNEYQRNTGMVYPMGYDLYMKQTFANKTFLLNCMNYLLDDEGLLQLRAREVKLRLLDVKKIEVQRTKWKIFNIALPLALVIAFGLLQFYLRKKRYAKTK